MRKIRILQSSWDLHVEESFLETAGENGRWQEINILIIPGIVLGGGTIITDRFIKRTPKGLVIVLYRIAVILILVGMIVSKHEE